MNTTHNPAVPAPRSFLATWPVWLVGVLAAVVAAALTELFALATSALGVPMEAASGDATEAAPIPLGGFAMAVLIWSVVGIILAVVLARWAKRPARTFVVTTVVLTVLSLIGPALATHTATSTKIVLALAHLVAAAVVIPLLAIRLSHQAPKR